MLNQEIINRLEYRCRDHHIKLYYDSLGKQYILSGQGDIIARALLATRAKGIVVNGEAWDLEDAMHQIYNMGKINFGFSDLIF